MGTFIVGHRLGIGFGIGVLRTVLLTPHLRKLTHKKRISGIEADHAVPPKKDARHSVIGGRKQEGEVESNLQRAGFHIGVPVGKHTLGAEAQVPLSNHAGYISRLTEQLRKRQNICWNTQRRIRRQHMNSVPETMHPGQHRKARRRTGGRRAMAIGKA